MALIVEDGTGKADAQSYATAQECRDYATAHGLPDEPEDVDAALVRATAWLDAAYEWEGTRTKGREQALAWPRKGAEDAEGHKLPDDEVPREVVNATCAAALYNGDLTTVYDPAKRIQTARVDGAVSVTYATPTAEQRVVLSAVDDALATLIGKPHRGATVVGWSERA